MELQQLDLFGNPIPVTPKKPKTSKAETPPPDVVTFTRADEIAEPNASSINQIESTAQETVLPTKLNVEEKFPTDQSDGATIFRNNAIGVKVKAKAVVAANVAAPVKADEPTMVEETPIEPTPFFERKRKTAEEVLPQKRGRKSYKSLENSLENLEVPDDETLNKKLYYSISEVSKWFKVNNSQIRFWENEFDILKPRKTRKGDRLFRVEDIKNLVLIHYLLRNKKFSIEGAKDYLKTHRQEANQSIALVQSLTKVRTFLLELKASINA